LFERIFDYTFNGKGRTIRLHNNGEDRKNLEKQSLRLKAFCKKAASEAYAYHRISLLHRGIKKSGDNSDRKVILSSECPCKSLVVLHLE
jgi:hypothetical protein